MKDVDGEIRAYRIVPNLAPSVPTFTTAASRILMAGDRCNAIGNLLDEVADNWGPHMHARARMDDQDGTIRLHFEGTGRALANLGSEATVLASEALHHARTALDYVAHNAAWLDGGTPNPNTQFPLAETRTEWNKVSRSRWTRGISDEHLGWIEQVQPWRGVAWSSSLRRLSNQDKHRVAVDLRPFYGIEFPMGQLTADPLGDPAWTGFNVTKREIGLLIGDGLAGSDREDDVEALSLLWDVVKGVTEVANKFLSVEGLDEIQITAGTKVTG